LNLNLNANSGWVTPLDVDFRIFNLGIILILYNSARLLGFFSFMNLSKQEEADKMDYREINTKDNCTKCKYYDSKSNESSKANCKFFHIKVDENHICDLFSLE
jgi:hypothetical protein